MLFRSKAAKDAYDQVEQSLAPDVKVPLNNTQNVANDYAAKKMALNQDPFSGAVQEVLGPLSVADGLTYQQIKELRTTISRKAENIQNLDMKQDLIILIVELIKFVVNKTMMILVKNNYQMQNNQHMVINKVINQY